MFWPERHGHGKLTVLFGIGLGSEEGYEGEWRHGLRSGHGVARYANGDVHEGHWAHDRRNGAGTTTYADGSSYTGKWIGDVRCGEGTLTAAPVPAESPETYSGQWAAGRKQGLGRHVLPNGDAYTGQWRDGVRPHTSSYYNV